MGLWLVMVILVAVVAAKGPENTYTTRFDGIRVEMVLNNDRIVKQYIQCILDQGPCTAEGRELKKRIPEALQSDCAKCSVVQRRQALKVLHFLAKNKRNYWDQLAKKYDPNGIYRKKYNLEK